MKRRQMQGQPWALDHHSAPSWEGDTDRLLCGSTEAMCGWPQELALQPLSLACSQPSWLGAESGTVSRPWLSGEPLPLRAQSSPEGGLGFVPFPPSIALSLLNLYQF